jgi:hypothetical protein
MHKSEYTLWFFLMNLSARTPPIILAIIPPQTVMMAAKTPNSFVKAG